MYEIKTDTHTHTIFSGHAYSTIEENVISAVFLYRTPVFVIMGTSGILKHCQKSGMGYVFFMEQKQTL